MYCEYAARIRYRFEGSGSRPTYSIAGNSGCLRISYDLKEGCSACLVQASIGVGTNIWIGVSHRHQISKIQNPEALATEVTTARIRSPSPRTVFAPSLWFVVPGKTRAAYAQSI